MTAQIATTAIVLSRINYSEADRIITCLTPDSGKVSLIAKGVRKQHSKLAGGIELFSVANISFIRGKGEIGTLTSSRLINYFSNIVSDLKRTKTGFKFLKIINQTTEDQAGEEWYELIKGALEALDNQNLALELIELWFSLQWLKLSGHSPNLKIDTHKKLLQPGDNYFFDFDKMAFLQNPKGAYGADHIKLLRLAIASTNPVKLGQITDSRSVMPRSADLSRAMLAQFVRL